MAPGLPVLYGLEPQLKINNDTLLPAAAAWIGKWLLCWCWQLQRDKVFIPGNLERKVKENIIMVDLGKTWNLTREPTSMTIIPKMIPREPCCLSLVCTDTVPPASLGQEPCTSFGYWLQCPLLSFSLPYKVVNNMVIITKKLGGLVLKQGFNM